MPVIENHIGISCRLSPTEIRLNQFLMLRNEEVQFAYAHLGSAWRTAFGTEEYCTPNWGPQRIRMICNGSPVFLAIMVPKISDIYSIADLKGKTFATYPGGELFANSCLAYAGLSLKDCKVVMASGYVNALDLVKEGKAQAAYGAVNSTQYTEMYASPLGIRLLPLPYEGHEEQWKKVTEIVPAHQPIIIAEGVGPPPAWGVAGLCYFSSMYVYEGSDPAIGYWITRALDEGYEEFKDAVPHQTDYWNLTQFVSVLTNPIPYDPGCIAYFKEKGVWTPALEEHQKAMLQMEEQRITLWKEFLKDAEKKGMKVDPTNKESLSLWDTYWRPQWHP
jgi:TRAP transporter TAXI family solute receptor